MHSLLWFTARHGKRLPCRCVGCRCARLSLASRASLTCASGQHSSNAAASPALQLLERSRDSKGLVRCLYHSLLSNRLVWALNFSKMGHSDRSRARGEAAGLHADLISAMGPCFKSTSSLHVITERKVCWEDDTVREVPERSV